MEEINVHRVERLLFIHHVIVIALTIVCTILWVKVNILTKKLNNMKYINKNNRDDR